MNVSNLWSCMTVKSLPSEVNMAPFRISKTSKRWCRNSVLSTCQVQNWISVEEIQESKATDHRVQHHKWRRDDSEREHVWIFFQLSCEVLGRVKEWQRGEGGISAVCGNKRHWDTIIHSHTLTFSHTGQGHSQLSDLWVLWWASLDSMSKAVKTVLWVLWFLLVQNRPSGTN